MGQGHMKEKERLDRLAGAAAQIAQEFERSGDRRAAVAAQVLFSMIIEQIAAVDEELDAIIEKAGI